MTELLPNIAFAMLVVWSVAFAIKRFSAIKFGDEVSRGLVAKNTPDQILLSSGVLVNSGAGKMANG